MIGVNKIFIAGNLGGKPELYSSKNGKKYTSLSLATHRSVKNENGDWEQKTRWHRVLVWGKQAERCTKHLQTGAAVVVQGHLDEYSYQDAEGEKRWKQVINADEVDFFSAQPFAQFSGQPTGPESVEIQETTTAE